MVFINLGWHSYEVNFPPKKDNECVHHKCLENKCLGCGDGKDYRCDRYCVDNDVYAREMIRAWESNANKYYEMEELGILY